MKHNSDVPEQLALFAIAPTQIRTTVHDPYWDEILAPEHPQPDDRWNPSHFGEVPRKLDADGQLTIFFDEGDEPPDPDDYLNKEEYEQAWREWESTVREQDTQVSILVSEISEKIPGDRLSLVREHDTHISAPEHSTLRSDSNPAPEHTHWIEEYWVKRCGKKYNYWRYCWMEGRKIKRCHLGGVRSRLAKHKKADVEVWISDGLSPQEIGKLIRSWRRQPDDLQPHL